VEPIDAEWMEQLQDKSGMTVRRLVEEARRPVNNGVHVTSGTSNYDIADEDKGEFADLIFHSIGRKVIWPDITALTDWDSGATLDDNHELVTIIINPFQNLFHFYFGAQADSYVSGL